MKKWRVCYKIIATGEVVSSGYTITDSEKPLWDKYLALKNKVEKDKTYWIERQPDKIPNTRRGRWS